MFILVRFIKNHILLSLIMSLIISYFALSKDIYLNRNLGSLIVSVLNGECEVSPCGTSSFCAVNTGTCTYFNSTYSECKCDDGYTTPDEDGNYMCCYEQYNSMTAFLLEIFISFGVGHMYIGDYLLGVLKMIIYLVLFSSTIFICFYRCKHNDKYEIETSFIYRLMRMICFLLCGCVYVAWQMIDSILFSLGGYVDKNGVALY